MCASHRYYCSPLLNQLKVKIKGRQSSTRLLLTASYRITSILRERAKSIFMARHLITAFIIVFLSALLSSCDKAGKYQIDLNDTANFGFTKSEIVNLGRLILIDYALFEVEPSKTNPSFPTASSFPREADLFKQFAPIANLQGKDKAGSQRQEFYGHIWRSNDSSSTLVISIRGTSGAQEWIDDVKFELVPFSDKATHGQVELGFKEIFNSFTLASPDSASVISLNDYLESLHDIETLIVVGHSLGSSLATLTAYSATQLVASTLVKSLTFASPLTGDSAFANAYRSNIVNGIRIVNQPDIVPRLPLPEMGYQQVWHEVEVSSLEQSETVNSVACYHSLNTYLHLLDSRVDLEPSCRSGK